MTKQEVIQQAYGECWDGFNNTAKKCALSNNGYISPILENAPEGIELDYIINGAYRPKSLQGIENNNGWIKGTPKEDMYCHILFSDGTQSIDRFLKEHGNFICHHYKSVTHYQPIEKRKPPIY